MNENRVYKAFSTVNENRTSNGLIFDIDVIKQDILNTVKTRKGEYPMDVTRGCLINDYIFNPELSPSEQNIIVEDMEEQLGRDPRFYVNDIQLLEFGEKRGIALILNITVYKFDTDIQLEIDFKD